MKKYREIGILMGCSRIKSALPMLLLLPALAMKPVFAQEGEEKRGIRIESNNSVEPISRPFVQPHFEEPRFTRSADEVVGDVRVLPEPEAVAVEDRRVENATTMDVARIELNGCSVFSAGQIEEWTAPYSGRKVSVDELQSLRQFLSLQYLQLGYVNSGVIIPEQSIADGVIVFEAIEGHLDQVALTGNDDIDSRYIEHRLRKGLASPLNVNSLQDALRSLQQNRLIGKVDAQLKPLTGLGEAELGLHVVEAPSRDLAVAVSNHRSTSIGSGVLEVAYTDHNLTGAGDRLDVQLALTEGLEEIALAYALPIPDTDLLITSYLSTSDSEVVEKPFEQLDIESESTSYGVRLSGPIRFAEQFPLSVYVGMNHRESDAFLLGQPFSFSSGAVDGESSSTTIEFGADFIARSSIQVLAANLSVRQGIDALDASVSDSGDIPDGEFTAIYGQVQYALRMEQIAGSQLIVRGAFQNSLDALLPLEKIAIGGHSTVRGYRENQLVRDNGVILSAEWRVPVFQSEQSTHNLQGILFADWGEAWDEDVPDQEDEKIAIGSVGAGLLWTPLPDLEFELFWAEALDDEITDGQMGKWQDDGIHVALRYGVSF